MTSSDHSFQRYLAAKRSVDARAFNHGVWQTLIGHFKQEKTTPLRVMELGGGTGILATRILEARLAPEIHYTLVDFDDANISIAHQQLERFLGNQAIQIEFVSADALIFLHDQAGQQWDLLIAHAFLDLLDLETAVPQLLSALRPGGYFYFPINYDGLTVFEPPVDPEFESVLLAAYNRSMDERMVNRRPSGDSRTGRHLFGQLADCGAEVLAAGPSDWLVFPHNGLYPEDEAFFLEFILAIIEKEMNTKEDIDQLRLNAWLEKRRAQITNCELIYLAHQLDYFGRRRR